MKLPRKEVLASPWCQDKAGIPIVLFIPRWRPATLNEMASSNHWSKRSRLKAGDREMVAAYWHKSRLPKATDHRHVALLIVLPPKQRAWDKDALWKSCADSLVACGALVDDSPRYCTFGSVEYARALGDCWGTYIHLNDGP